MNGAAVAMAIVAVALLAAQRCAVRPLLSCPSDRVLARGAASRWAKAFAVAAGILLLPG